MRAESAQRRGKIRETEEVGVVRGKTFTRIRIKSDEFRGVSTTKDEAISSPTSSPMSYNFTYEKGVLQGKYGISAATFPSDVTPAFRHAVASLPEGVVPMSLHLFRKFDAATNKRDDRLIVRTTDNEYYETSVFTVGDTFRKIVNLAAAGKDCSACYRYNGKDLFLASSERGFFYTYDGTTLKKIENAPKMTSMCVHAERIFATVSGEQNKVWFSADFNPENWKVSGDGAGYIDFDDEGGKVIKVVKFLNYVYVFRDFGVERLTAFGAQTDFSVSKIYTASARIYPDTIVPLGDRIVFLTEEGLKCLDGYNVQNIFADLSDFLSKDKRNAVATGMDGKYFLAANMVFPGDFAVKFLDEVRDQGVYNTNGLAVCDVKKNKMTLLRGMDIRFIKAVNVHTLSSVFMTFAGVNKHLIGMFSDTGRYFSDKLPRYWTTGYTDLGYPEKQKSVRNVMLTAHGTVTLGLELDGNKIEYDLTGADLPQKIIVNRAFSKMRVYLKENSESGSYTVTPPSITVDLS